MRARLERMMETYGQSVILSRRDTGETATVRAFLQPILRRQEDLPVTATPLGAVSGQRWLYIGQSGQELRPGDRVACGKLRLVVQETRAVWWKDEILYCWALLRREKEAAE